ncbi:MAG TPA: Holliday junction resolvase RuvX [Polyangiaceae bacterium]|nr:Holliday junction resolvase RuvX [Polyangiaceae bacterium]
MRVAAVDLGKVRVGLAVSDELGLMAHARPPMDGQNRKKLVADLAKLAREEQIGRFLVGWPLDRAGGEGAAATRARSFAHALANATGCEVELVDERRSTILATQKLRAAGISARRERALIDGVAASVLLQAWLDRRREPAD